MSSFKQFNIVNSILETAEKVKENKKTGCISSLYFFGKVELT